ncbi:MAG: B12-binding domain-containing protein [Candidatus Aminicenantes bacterium]|nr:B12-binding domain-containing protein [Candidatus Aminicenantes bacterium]
MERDELLSKMTDAVINGLPADAGELARRGLRLGLEPTDIIDRGFVPGIRRAGELWESGDYFLPELVSSAEAMKAAMAVLQPEIEKSGSRNEGRSLARVVIGTVEGDIHDIGKNLVAALLSANGFEVHDLGANVSPERFLDKALEVDADFIGLSTLLTTTMLSQRRFLERLKETGHRSRFKVLVGGAPVTGQWAADIGADGFAENAVAAVGLCRKLLGERP